jgi:uncharacterized membrane protein YccF (DUF307 family)
VNEVININGIPAGASNLRLSQSSLRPLRSLLTLH